MLLVLQHIGTRGMNEARSKVALNAYKLPHSDRLELSGRLTLGGKRKAVIYILFFATGAYILAKKARRGVN